MENKTCENCKHFFQHYIKFQGRYTTVYCGHCVYPGLKNRKPDNKACEHYKKIIN